MVLSVRARVSLSECEKWKQTGGVSSSGVLLHKNPWGLRLDPCSWHIRPLADPMDPLVLLGKGAAFPGGKVLSPSQPFHPLDGFNSLNSTNYRGQQERDSQSCTVSACLLSVMMAKFWLKGHLNLLRRWEEYFFWDYPCVKRCSLFRILIKNNNNTNRRAAGAFSSEITPRLAAPAVPALVLHELQNVNMINEHLETNPSIFCSPA